MEITKNLLKEKFNLFNEKYFENKICNCNFRVEKDNLNLGSFIEKNVSKPIISVSKDDFINNEKGWTEDRLDNTLLHEMIHPVLLDSEPQPRRNARLRLLRLLVTAVGYPQHEVIIFAKKG